MNAHFIDIDTILVSDQKAWIVSKDNPKNPLIKIEIHEFNLYKSGIYKSQGNKLNFNGSIFYLPEIFMNKLKTICRKNKLDISNLSISMQEFMDSERISESHFEIDMDPFQSIINTDDKIYLIASKNKENGYEKILKKLDEKIQEIGLQISDVYYLSETFYNRQDDEISYLKVKILLQHLIGYKTTGNQFTNEEISEFDTIYYYDNDYKPINLSHKINEVLEKFLVNSNDISKVIKDKVRDVEKRLCVREVTPNKSQKIIEKNIILKTSNIIKSFENFKFKL
jgi:hypothetical protein